MTVTARCQRLIDAATAYIDAWRARKAFAEQFREEPRIDQVFVRATASQLDKNVTETRKDLERMAIRLQNNWSEQTRSGKNKQTTKETENDEEKYEGCRCSDAGNDSDTAAVRGITECQGE
jgi:uncharacterized protein YneF (UPF0154 family)